MVNKISSRSSLITVKYLVTGVRLGQFCAEAVAQSAVAETVNITTSRSSPTLNCGSIYTNVGLTALIQALRTCQKLYDFFPSSSIVATLSKTYRNS